MSSKRIDAALIGSFVLCVFANFCLAQSIGGGAYPDLGSYAKSTDVPALARPAGASASSGLMYASTCTVNVTSSTPTSTFCPAATDPTSVTKRTYPAGGLTPGKSFYVFGGGLYSVPTGNLLPADVAIKVGSATVMSIQTPAAPVGSNQGVEFYALCTVRTSTTINCQGSFKFIVAGAAGAPIGFAQTGTFDPAPANTVDVTGDWNGTTTSHVCAVSQAVLLALN